ncbi:MAG: UDP-2,3-diacylglucosamine diphosphatase [Bacteroidota bacterium]
MESAKKIYFASDFHLGVPSHATSLMREKLICRWLDTVRQDASEIYLMGDLFDFWFEYHDVIPKGFARFMGKIAEITDSGIPVTIFKGNHDMWTFGYLAEELGVKVISDELIIERNGKKFFLHHGDGLGPGDKAYKWIRSFFRSKFAIALFGFLHPRIGAGFAKFLSRRSRIQNAGADKIYMGDDKEYITLFCKQTLTTTHYDYFICGHRHFPMDVKLSDSSRYINLGEWVNDFTYAEFNGTNIELKVFKP